MKVSSLSLKTSLIMVSYCYRTRPAYWSQLSPWEFHYLWLFSFTHIKQANTKFSEFNQSKPLSKSKRSVMFKNKKDCFTLYFIRAIRTKLPLVTSHICLEQMITINKRLWRFCLILQNKYFSSLLIIIMFIYIFDPKKVWCKCFKTWAIYWKLNFLPLLPIAESKSSMLNTGLKYAICLSFSLTSKLTLPQTSKRLIWKLTWHIINPIKTHTDTYTHTYTFMQLLMVPINQLKTIKK